MVAHCVLSLGPPNKIIKFSTNIGVSTDPPPPSPPPPKFNKWKHHDEVTSAFLVHTTFIPKIIQN